METGIGLAALNHQTVPSRVTIFTFAQAAISWMVSEDPGPGQKYAILARQHIATLRRTRSDITIEIRWCVTHKGVTGNEKADKWAKLWQKSRTRMEWRRFQGHSCTSSVKSREKKWMEAHQWAESRINKEKYKMPAKQKPDGTVAGSARRHASRFYQLKTGHCLTG
jgi:hypothetical protein